MNKYNDLINEYLSEEICIIRELNVDSINEVLIEILDTYNRGGKIYVFGNGGSASTASHLANDFNKGLSEYLKKKFHTICLNDNIATIMAIANDISYDEVFRFQLRGNIDENDLVIAFSGSGNSKNVINAVKYAKRQGSKVIGLTGMDGGELRLLSDISLHVDSKSMQKTEDIHLMYTHLMVTVFLKTMLNNEEINHDKA